MTPERLTLVCAQQRDVQLGLRALEAIGVCDPDYRHQFNTEINVVTPGMHNAVRGHTFDPDNVFFLDGWDRYDGKSAYELGLSMKLAGADPSVCATLVA